MRKHHWRDVIAGGALGYGVPSVTPDKHLAPTLGRAGWYCINIILRSG
jgi:hypothetical protein